MKILANKNCQPLSRQICLISQRQPMSNTLYVHKLSGDQVSHHPISFKNRVSAYVFYFIYFNCILSELTEKVLHICSIIFK